MKLASCSSFIVVNMVKRSGCIMEPKNPIKILHLMDIVPYIIFSNAKETDSGQPIEGYDEQKTIWFLSFGGLDFYLDSLHVYLEQTCDFFNAIFETPLTTVIEMNLRNFIEHEEKCDKGCRRIPRCANGEVLPEGPMLAAVEALVSLI